MWLAGAVNYFLNAQQLSKVRRANMKFFEFILNKILVAITLNINFVS